jgi:hypothetical protein
VDEIAVHRRIQCRPDLQRRLYDIAMDVSRQGG